MIKDALYAVTHGQDLSYDLAKDTMNKIMSGDVAEVPMAGFLCALAAKGPTVDEVTAFAEVMREKAGSVPHEGTVVEIVGTGGDEANTFNISTTSGFIISAAGIPVAKHGNRSVSSKCGAADLIEALGAKLELNGEQNEAVLNKANMCFMFAPVYHQAMKYAGPVRKALGVRTVFNILGPLANPAGATVELMGVYDKSLVEPLARVLANLGVKRGAVVHGFDGLDEITATNKTYVCEINNGTFTSYEFDPKDYGFEYADKTELEGGDATVNAEITRRVLGGEQGGKRTAVLLNAGMAIYLAKEGLTLAEGIEKAKHMIDSGKALATMEQFVKATQEVQSLILDKIIEATKIRVAQEKEVETPEAVKAAALALPSDTGFPFEAALRQQDFNFICEVKKASPSKGIIAEHFPYLDIAKEYEVAGAAAISVLTEPDFFKGDKKYLQEIASTVKIPVLRKDFIIDEYQIYQAKVWGASAILLICACLDVPTLTKFRELADSLGLSSLVEAHDEHEVQMAIDCGARIIGVNNRNLKDFTVDVQNSVRLRNLVQDDVIFVSESGLETPEDIQVLRDNNIGVALMGETFMRSPNKVEKLAYLYGPTYYTPKVKMCGISKVETIPAIIDAKPDYMGLVFAPSKRQVTVEQAKTLVEELYKQNVVGNNSEVEQTEPVTSLDTASSETIKTVGVFVNETVENLLKIAEEVKLDVIQLHGDEDESFIQILKEQSNVEVWKAVQVRSAADAEKWIDSSADMLLFDAYHKDERGGTGEVFDWSSLDEFDRPFMLAGGIDSTNVARAIRTVRPYGIDISSGIETEGVKDNEKIKAFTNIVRTIALS